jgi:hypothetical protein
MPQAETITLERSGHHVGVDAREGLIAILRNAASPAASGFHRRRRFLIC